MMLEASKNLTAKILSKEREQYSQTLAFAFVLRKYPQVAVATHAIAREMIASTAHELDAFMSEHGVFAPAVDTCLANCIAALPCAVQQTVL
jgi:hypothetical protein